MLIKFPYFYLSLICVIIVHTQIMDFLQYLSLWISKVDENCMSNVSLGQLYLDRSSLVSTFIWLKYHKEHTCLIVPHVVYYWWTSFCFPSSMKSWRDDKCKARRAGAYQAECWGPFYMKYEQSEGLKLFCTCIW